PAFRGGPGSPTMQAAAPQPRRTPMATGTITVPISVTSVSSTSTIFIDVDTYAQLYQQVTVTAPNGTKIINAAVGNGENTRIAAGSYSVSATGIYNFTVQIAHSSSKTGPWTP